MARVLTGAPKPPPKPKPAPTSGYTQSETSIAPAQQQKAGNNKVQKDISTANNTPIESAGGAGAKYETTALKLGTATQKAQKDIKGTSGGAGKVTATMGFSDAPKPRTAPSRNRTAPSGGGGGGGYGGSRTGDHLGVPDVSGRPPGSSGYNLSFDRALSGDQVHGETTQQFGGGAGAGGGGGGGGAAGSNPIQGGQSLKGLSVDDVISYGAKSTKKQRQKSKTM